ncbi:hypothetical protein CSC94_11785 [Zhengella mangrovi]|uniref:EthD domain-containing protein n=1 Tax=Zhengella mangrovi TaxID=1982044 RepID=A0A2G1QMU3_9HYPH|nr:EthD domain-containing protein [Zhengella mangrovi]PHP66781.1 hypothetical protein CSC94_11785 [Zhengella mangrovi]
MIKRITLLRRKEDISDAAFRKHWAEPHAEIAKGFEGMEGYNQNRVDAIFWQTGEIPFHVDGIVELWFASQETVDRNAVSETTKALIADEPRFLAGLTGLTVGEAEMNRPMDPTGKLMVLACTRDVEGLRNAIEAALSGADHGLHRHCVIEPLAPGFTRELLWSEPTPPNMAVTVRIAADGANDIAVSRGSGLHDAFASHSDAATAYVIDELRIV